MVVPPNVRAFAAVHEFLRLLCLFAAISFRLPTNAKHPACSRKPGVLSPCPVNEGFFAPTGLTELVSGQPPE
jgi:hypothetical protein